MYKFVLCQVNVTYSEVTQPSITELQAFAWKVNAPQKIRHLIWQLISGQVTVTRNLIHRNLRCDNYCLRCGEPEENITHAIFECPPATSMGTIIYAVKHPNFPHIEYVRYVMTI